MKQLKICLATLFIFLISYTVQAQNKKTDLHNLTKQDYAEYPYWTDMMKDLSINFYDVQEAFEIYFKDRGKGKGSGWKQFKRWEYFTEQRVFPTGERIKHDQVWNEMMQFNKDYPQRSNDSKNTWTSLGPNTSLNVTGHWNPGIGRINVIALDPNDSDIIYIGSPSGGLWKTTDEGANWTVLTDHLPVLGVSAIAVDYTDTDIIYIGTGDKDANDNYSIGVLKSTDGGVTWEVTGLDWTIYQNRTISKLLIHPDNPNILFAATTDGLYKTIDAGDNWYNVQSGNIDDIEFKPGDPTVVYAITQSFYRSTDSGESFNYINEVPGTSRSQIAVSEDDPNSVYFFSYQSGIYRSTDSGITFTKTSNEPNQGSQGWYDLAFAVSHADAEEVHLGEINTWRSTNGGVNWTQTTDWTWNNSIGYTHCDIHEMVFYGSTLYVGSDGLISKSTDGGDTWTNLTEGISIRQFYRIGCSKTNPYKILGGSQDNGTSVYTEDHWHEWLGADGMECIVDYTNDDIVYGTSQFGNFYKSTNGGNHGGVSISQPGGGAWVTPFVMHPTDPQILFVGLENVRKTTNGMNSWTTISNFTGGDINAMAIAESDPDYLYVSKSSTIYRTKDGGTHWDNISTGLPGGYITYITVHPENPEKIAVSLSGYSDNQKVYTSNDGGDTWTNISDNLPNLPANCVVYHNDENAGLYVGMDVGVYYRDDTFTEWEAFMTGLPNVIVNELEINYPSGKIRAGTYGRGLWEADLHAVTPIDFTFNYTIKSGGDDIIEYGETVYLDIEMENNTDESATDVSMTISIDDQYISLTDNTENFGTIAAGESVSIPDAFAFNVATNVPDDHTIDFDTEISSSGNTYEGNIKLTAYAPQIEAGQITVNDGNDGVLDPGESASIEVTINNNGGASSSNIDLLFSTSDEYTQISNNSTNISVLGSGNSDVISFDIVVDGSAPAGHAIEFDLDITAANGYANSETFGLTVGLVIEDFETGDFSMFPWQHSGDADWFISDDVFEGSFSAQSEDIGDSQQAVLSLEMDILSDGEISFYKKVSCENDPNGTNYDYLAFLIDDVLQGSWDGEVDWSQETYNVTAGTRTFKWVYYKDVYVSDGSDCAWIDYIIFPSVDTETSIDELIGQSEGHPVKLSPNPFKKATLFTFRTDTKCDVSLEIYDINGKKITTLIHDSEMSKGIHSVEWNGTDNSGNNLPQGIYFYRLHTDKEYNGSVVLVK
jgi:photosystem II stability/assembly factor-like uncharacterized protein